MNRMISEKLFARGSLIYISVLFFILLSCARPNPIKPVFQAQVHKSEEQRLTIKNTHGTDIKIEPIDNNNDSIILKPDDQLSVKFIVMSVGDLQDSDNYDWYVFSGNYVNYIEESGPRKFLKSVGLNLEMDLRDADNNLEKISLSLQNCPGIDWHEIVAQPAEHLVGSKQLPGVTFRICPKLSQ